MILSAVEWEIFVVPWDNKNSSNPKKNLTIKILWLNWKSEGKFSIVQAIHK
jgi:hypothetical protein